MNVTTSHSRYAVSGNGHGIEGRAGASLLTAVADRIGLTDALRDAVDDCRSWRDHPPGRVVRDLAVMLADGGTTISDIETVRRGHPVLFGPVASEPTAWRTIEALAAHELADIAVFDALGQARRQAWTAGAQNKAPHLDYPTALANGWPIATGVIEGACRHLIKDRLDLTGARWGLEGAEAILKLRAITTNGDFDAYWQHHLDQEHHRVHHSRHVPNLSAQAA